MKQRLTSLDIRCVVNELKSVLLNKFIQNIYSNKQRFFYFKINKEILLIEIGQRLHLTNEYKTEISHFCKKLREKFRHSKIKDIYQYGFDRIVVLEVKNYKILIEFFSLGNIIILDENDIIIEIHRPVENLNIIKGTKYIFNQNSVINLENIGFNLNSLNINNNSLIEKLENIFPLEKKFLELKIKEYTKKNQNTVGVENYVLSESQNIKNFGLIRIKNKKPFDFSSYKEEESSKSVKINKNLIYDIKNENVDLKDNLDIDFSKKSLIYFNSFNDALHFYFNFHCSKNKSIDLSKKEKILIAQNKYIKTLELQKEDLLNIINILNINISNIKEILKIFNLVYKNKLNWKNFDFFFDQERKKNNNTIKPVKSYDLEKKTIILNL